MLALILSIEKSEGITKMSYTITVTNVETVGKISTEKTAQYACDERASLDHVLIMCENLYGMILQEYEDEDE